MDKVIIMTDAQNTDTLGILCNFQRINTINQHRYRGKITKEYADAARRIAQDCRDRALMDAEYARTQYKEDISQAGVYAAVEKAFGIKE